MKRFSALLLVVMLSFSLAACGPQEDPAVIPDVAPLTTEPSGSADPSASAAPKGSADASGSPAASATANPSASANASASPAGSATKAPQVTSAVSPTSTTGAGVDVDIVSGFNTMVSGSSYIVVGKITKDAGVVDILEGTKTRELAPNAYIGNWQYEMEVTQVLKTDSTAKITKGSTITVSLPYEYCMNTQTKPMEKEEAFVALAEGNSYVLFLDYDSELKFYTTAGFEPNKFSLSGSTMYILTGKEGLDIAWEAGAGKTGVSLASLEKACK